MILFNIFIFLALGILHCLESDHILTIVGIAPRTKNYLERISVGILWGFAHGFIVFLAISTIIFFKTYLNNFTLSLFEILVGILMFTIGLNLILKFKNKTIHEHKYSSSFLISLGMGFVHGLAGSGAAIAMLYAINFNNSIFAAVMFWIGNIIGMGLFSLFWGGLLHLFKNQKLLFFSIYFNLLIGILICSFGLYKVCDIVFKYI